MNFSYQHLLLRKELKPINKKSQKQQKNIIIKGRGSNEKHYILQSHKRHKDPVFTENTGRETLPS